MNKRWNKLFALREKSDLEYIKKELKVLNFTKNFKIINIVGTNGKGSSSKMIADSLEVQGYKVGLFTSPHLVLPNERISINGKDIDDEDFFKLYEQIESRQFFASIFIVAMKYFENSNIDYAVIEAGVGGRLDATNSVNGDYGLLTSVGLDHIEYLGNSHQSIFDDKVQIKNDGMEFFIPSYLPSDIKVDDSLNVIKNYSNDYQVRNKLLVSSFLERCFGIDLVIKGLPKGRTEVVSYKGFDCIFDVSHNLSGIKAALSFIDAKNLSYDEVVISLAKRKDDKGILELFCGKKVRYFKPDNSFRDFELEEIKDIKEFNPSSRTLFIGSFRLIGALYE